MGNIPKERFSITTPFHNTGVDFAGPFLVKPSKLRRETVLKCYMAVFVCMTTRAIHLELVSSLTTNDFLHTLKRFIESRGYPKVILSDNGTTFHGANNKLRDIYNFFKDDRNESTIKNYLGHQEITWKFILAKSPHWGGLWEAAVKAGKYHLIRTPDASLTYEEFSTVLIEIEAILNSRLLCPLSSNPSELECLTPGHFLIGKSMTSFPEKNETKTTTNRLDRWRHCTQLKQRFWKKWMTEYISQLQKRIKWILPKNNLAVGDIVLLMNEESPPFKWPLARVAEVFLGPDGKVRSVRVRTNSGAFIRCISKLCPLPLKD